MIIRWLGLYKEAPSLHAALAWEIQARDVEAAGLYTRGGKTRTGEAKVGLVFPRRGSVRRAYPTDVWSDLAQNGKLLARHQQGSLPHTEVFLRKEARPIGILVRGRVSRKAWRTIRWFAKRYGLPVYEWTEPRTGRGRRRRLRL